MAIISIVGAGMMGSALAVPLIDRGHEVRLVGTPLDAEIILSLRSTFVHPKLGIELPRSIRAFFDAELEQALAGADALVLGVSSAGIGWASERLRPFASADRPIAMISKGLTWTGRELRVLPDVFADGLVGGRSPAARLADGLGEPARSAIRPVGIAGPCIAGELARRAETCVVFSGRDAAVTKRFAELARGPYYHVRTSPDVVGVEICAALKNAYAMGIAFAIGLHERRGGKPGSVALHNYEAAVFAQSVAEMQALVCALGGDPASAVGLAGVGDLNVTCNGGRTGRFGRLLGLGLGVKEAILAMQGATLECLEILEVLQQALPALELEAKIRRAELPLLLHMIEVALEGKPIEMPFPSFFGGTA